MMGGSLNDIEVRAKLLTRTYATRLRGRCGIYRSSDRDLSEEMEMDHRINTGQKSLESIEKKQKQKKNKINEEIQDHQ